MLYSCHIGEIIFSIVPCECNFVLHSTKLDLRAREYQNNNDLKYKTLHI